jgi:hypothetical protein
VAVGDNLDQVLSELTAQTQERQKRRIPAPTPSVPPSVGGDGRPAPARPPQGQGGPSILQRVGKAATAAVDTMFPGLGTTLGLVAQHPQGAVGVAAGVLRSPVTAAAGLADFGADVAHAVSPHADPRNYQASISHAGVQFRYSPTKDTYSKFARDLTPLGHAGDDNANEIASNIASLAVGYGAGAKLAQFAGVAPKIEQVVQSFGNPIARSAASLAVRAGGGGIVDAMVMDPETERFSNILQQIGVHTEFTDWLAHKDDEGKLEGRFKNAVEGTGLGAAADGLFQAARYWRLRLRGDTPGQTPSSTSWPRSTKARSQTTSSRSTPAFPRPIPPSRSPATWVAGRTARREPSGRSTRRTRSRVPLLRSKHRLPMMG